MQRAGSNLLLYLTSADPRDGVQESVEESDIEDIPNGRNPERLRSVSTYLDTVGGLTRNKRRRYSEDGDEYEDEDDNGENEDMDDDDEL